MELLLALEIDRVVAEMIVVHQLAADRPPVLPEAGELRLAGQGGDIECAFSVSFQWGRTLPIMTVTVAPFAFGDLDMWRSDDFRNSFFWYGRNVPIEFTVPTVLSPLLIALATGDSRTSLDPDRPDSPDLICPDADCG